MNKLKHIFLFLILFISYSTLLHCQQGSAKKCINAEPLCASTLFSYPNTSGINFAENGPDYGCVSVAVNPAWFYFQIDSDGDIQLKISQSTVLNGASDLDVDFVAYGPFNDPILPCEMDLQAVNIADCSFKPDFVEYLDISNAMAGDYYLLLITNYSINPGFINVEQTLGTATTNCNLLNEPIVSDIIACEGETATLDATTTNAKNYIWYEDDGFGNFNTINGANAQFYDVTNTNVYRAEAFDINHVFLEHYEFNATFYLPPEISAEVISYAFVQDNDIRVTATGIWLQEPEFSIDGNPWQESSVFNNVSMGEHSITVRNAIGCGETSITVMVMDYPLYFTPNGDGVHDTWNIVGLQNQLQAKIYIYDRYGKLLKQLNPNGLGWDGTYNGKTLTTDDYWFMLEYIEPRDGKLKQFKSHFALKQ